MIVRTVLSTMMISGTTYVYIFGSGNSQSPTCYRSDDKHLMLPPMRIGIYFCVKSYVSKVCLRTWTKSVAIYVYMFWFSVK